MLQLSHRLLLIAVERHVAVFPFVVPLNFFPQQSADIAAAKHQATANKLNDELHLCISS